MKDFSILICASSPISFLGFSTSKSISLHSTITVNERMAKLNPNTEVSRLSDGITNQGLCHVYLQRRGACVIRDKIKMHRFQCVWGSLLVKVTLSNEASSSSLCQNKRNKSIRAQKRLFALYLVN